MGVAQQAIVGNWAGCCLSQRAAWVAHRLLSFVPTRCIFIVTAIQVGHRWMQMILYCCKRYGRLTHLYR